MPAIILGEFEQIVLLALLRLGPDAYGMSIYRAIVDRTGREVSLGAVYKTLERLETKGLVSGRIGKPTQERGGRRKKHYRLLAAGEQAVRRSLTALRHMTDGLPADLKV